MQDKEEIYMKSFLEEYGLVVVAAIIIGLFISFASPFGNSIKTYITSTVDNFAASSQSAITGSMNGGDENPQTNAE